MRFKHILDAKKRILRYMLGQYLQGLFFKELNFIKKNLKI